MIGKGKAEMEQGDLFNMNSTGGKVGANHPETSQRAAINVKSGSQKAQAVKHLGKVFPEGETAYDLSVVIFNGAGRAISPNQTATRLGELHDDGIVEFALDGAGQPLQRVTTPGNTGYVHVLSSYGHKVLVDINIQDGGLQSKETTEALLRKGDGDRIRFKRD